MHCGRRTKTQTGPRPRLASPQRAIGVIRREHRDPIGRQRIGLVRTRNGLRLQRIINTESFRFPQLLMLNYNQSAKPVTDFIIELLEREAAQGRVRAADPRLAASVFLSMVVSGPVRQIVAGEPPAPDHPLLAFDQVIVTPHTAGLTAEAAERMAVTSVQNVLDFFAGRLDPALVVNAAALSGAKELVK